MRLLFVKMKKKVKSDFNFSNRILYSLICLVVLSIVAVGVYAVPGTIPNPGHPISQLQLCSDGETLVMVGGAWTCATGGGALGNYVTGSFGISVGDISSVKLTVGNSQQVVAMAVDQGIGAGVLRTEGDWPLILATGGLPGALGGAGDEPYRESVYILPDGNVGIGTTSPNGKLDVMDTILGLTTGLSFGSWHDPVGGTAGGLINAIDDNGNARPLVLQTSGGNVGIGTIPGPQVKLAIGDGDTGISYIGDGSFALTGNGENRLKIGGNGAVYISNLCVPDGSSWKSLSTPGDNSACVGEGTGTWTTDYHTILSEIAPANRFPTSVKGGVEGKLRVNFGGAADFNYVEGERVHPYRVFTCTMASCRNNYPGHSGENYGVGQITVVEEGYANSLLDGVILDTSVVQAYRSNSQARCDMYDISYGVEELCQNKFMTAESYWTNTEAPEYTCSYRCVSPPN